MHGRTRERAPSGASTSVPPRRGRRGAVPTRGAAAVPRHRTAVPASGPARRRDRRWTCACLALGRRYRSAASALGPRTAPGRLSTSARPRLLTGSRVPTPEMQPRPRRIRGVPLHARVRLAGRCRRRRRARAGGHRGRAVGRAAQLDDARDRIAAVTRELDDAEAHRRASRAPSSRTPTRGSPRSRRSSTTSPRRSSVSAAPWPRPSSAWRRSRTRRRWSAHALEARAASMFKQGAVRDFDVLLSSEGAEEALARSTYLRALTLGDASTSEALAAAEVAVDGRTRAAAGRGGAARRDARRAAGAAGRGRGAAQPARARRGRRPGAGRAARGRAGRPRGGVRSSSRSSSERQQAGGPPGALARRAAAAASRRSGGGSGPRLRAVVVRASPGRCAPR